MENFNYPVSKIGCDDKIMQTRRQLDENAPACLHLEARAILGDVSQGKLKFSSVGEDDGRLRRLRTPSLAPTILARRTQIASEISNKPEVGSFVLL
ncbi:hypothetical protein Y032_0007g3386 [Ancylostoma ceylanicum]|uniref:Uncharacterized protein n=1 Tax=Ancylostoma ceylanicum TaxID=53326 RepID=A0A016VNW4_9BILA|nr:hypothetical protein Y032_0007g3386 [Ancylostoma ceylanicum]